MKRTLLMLLLTSLMCAQTTKSQTITRYSNYKLVWADEFDVDGAPNPLYWNHEIMESPPNNELEYYVNSRNNSLVKDGLLYIRARKEVKGSKNYTSARMTTMNKVDWTYGRVEVRAQLPAGVGTWPAIWMMPTKSVYGGWPVSGEIDIMEHVGKDINNVYASAHCKAHIFTNNTQNTTPKYLTDVESKFHVYICEWNPDSVKMFVDNSLYFKFKNDRKGFESWPFDQNFYLILNVAIGGDWGGTPNTAIFKNDTSVQMKVDYVRLFKRVSDFAISGSKIVSQQATNLVYSAPRHDGTNKFEWILPAGVTAVTKLDSNAIKLNWGCTSDTLRLKIMSDIDTSIQKYPVSIVEPQVKGLAFVDTTAQGVIYTVDSLPGATFNWTATEGITFASATNSKKVTVNFAKEGKVYAEVTTTCGVLKDSIVVKFGTGQTTYPTANKPAVIPGKIIAANFDKGGEGLSYHDLDAGNQGNVYRTTEDVDIEANDGTNTIGWFDAGEWVEYTVSVQTEGYYSLSVRLAAQGTVGKFDMFIDNKVVLSKVAVPTSGAWATFKTATYDSILLKSGVQVLKIYSYGGFNLGTMTFSITTGISNSKMGLNKQITFYPNPANDKISVQRSANAENASIQIFSIDGKLQLQVDKNANEINVSQWPRGVYVAKSLINNELVTDKIIIK